MHGNFMTMTKGDDNVTPIADIEWTDKLIRVLQELRSHNPDMTANHILTLLYIYREPGISQRGLSDKDHLDVAPGTLTRICGVLSERGNRGTPGQHLISITHAPGDYRKTAQFLTKKGRNMIDHVKTIMKGR